MASNIPVYSTVTFSDYLDSKETRIPQDGDNFVLSTPDGLQKVDTISLYNNIKNTLDIPESLNSIKDGEGESATIQGKIDENIASGQYSFASGNGTCASAANAHAEGYRTKALAINSHTEGNSSQVRFGAVGSHAEGAGTLITGGIGAHAEGRATTATATASHSGGDHTIARGVAQTAIGKYNIEDTNNKYAFIIGNGTSETASNAFAVDWNGAVETNHIVTTSVVARSLHATEHLQTNELTINGFLPQEESRFFVVEPETSAAIWKPTSSLLATDSQPGLMSAAYHQRLHILKAEFLSIAGRETAIIKSTGSTFRLMSVSHLYTDQTDNNTVKVKIGLYYFCSTSLTLYPIVYIGGNEDVIQQNDLTVTSDSNGNYSFTNNYGVGTTPIRIMFLGSRANSQLYSDFTSSIDGSVWEGPTSADI